MCLKEPWWGIKCEMPVSQASSFRANVRAVPLLDLISNALAREKPLVTGRSMIYIHLYINFV
jgi:hypothetical protein